MLFSTRGMEQIGLMSHKIEIPNDETRMANQTRMTNDECKSQFVIRASSFIRYSGLVIRYCLSGLPSDRHIEVLHHRLVHRPDDSGVGAGGGDGAEEHEGAG